VLRLLRLSAPLLPAAFLLAIFGTPAAAQTSNRPASWPTRVLVTNDDGIDSPGLHALVRALTSVAEVTVVAPAGNRSGSTSYALVLSGRVIVEQRDFDDARVAYAVTGYPADCVLIGLNGLMANDPPDLVVSGINTTANLADAWAYSGTLGAVRIATLHGIPSIAVSGGAPDALAAVAQWVADLVQSDVTRGLQPPRYLAVDVPNVPLADLAGVTLRPRAQGFLVPRLQRGARSAADIPGQQAWVSAGFSRHPEVISGTDVEALGNDQIVMTAMRADESDAEFLRVLQQRAAELPSWPPSR
jgi:5'-nucleotidase